MVGRVALSLHLDRVNPHLATDTTTTQYKLTLISLQLACYYIATILLDAMLAQCICCLHVDRFLPSRPFVRQGPGLQNILRQSYDYLTRMPKLRSTYGGRLIYKTSYEWRKAFLVRFACKVVRSSETVFAKKLTIFLKEILALFKSLS